MATTALTVPTMLALKTIRQIEKAGGVIANKPTALACIKALPESPYTDIELKVHFPPKPLTLAEAHYQEIVDLCAPDTYQPDHIKQLLDRTREPHQDDLVAQPSSRYDPNVWGPYSSIWGVEYKSEHRNHD